MGTYRGLFASGGAPTTTVPDPAPARHGGGLFGSTGAGRAITGSIGDALLQLGGMQPIYAPAAARAQQEAEYQRRLADQFARQKQLYDYKLANPEPVNNDTVNDINFWVNATPEQRAAYREMHPLYRVGPDGQYYPIAAPTTAPPPDTLPADFDFGDGGPAPQAPGMFP